jgi:N6-L-threonylcarbamoyladenine synthase
MIILALDTAGVDCAAALYDAGTARMLAERCERIGKGHAERLTGMIDEVMEEAGLSLSAVERIAVTVGPGSFTGIRTGVASARGLALALGVPAVGVTTLEILAAEFRERHPGKLVVAAIDARRGEIYAQPYDGEGRALAPAAVLDRQAVADLASAHGAAIHGSGAAVVHDEIVNPEPDRFPLGLAARLASAIIDPEKPKPLYLRAPDAKPQSGFALSRI